MILKRSLQPTELTPTKIQVITRHTTKVKKNLQDKIKLNYCRFFFTGQTVILSARGNSR